METKHTKGNWVYQKYSTDYGVYSETGNGRDIALVREYGSDEEAEANAKLIAAAPEMLEALIEINKMIADSVTCNGVKLNTGIIAKISMSAIRKATEE